MDRIKREILTLFEYFFCRSLIEARPELKYNIEAVDTLIRASLVNMLQFDANLATSMEKGTNLPAVIFSMELVKMYLIEERFNSHVSESDLYHTVSENK